MKKYQILILVLVIGLGARLQASESPEYPHIALVGPGGGRNPINANEYITIVVEGPYLSCEGTQIPDATAVDYINKLLKTKGVTYIGVYPREGIKYGDLVRAIDILRRTEAKNVGVSMLELKIGREI